MFVSADARGLRSVGIFGFDVRGLAYYERAARRSDTRPGTRVELVREPLNDYQSAAIAIHPKGAGSRVGYVNKGMAPGLAKLLDAGTELSNIVLRGAAPGENPSGVTVLVARPETMAHLCRTPWPKSVVCRGQW
ncbi:HIRAN domain-containing protein [Nakamurella aerolata]|uniref:HIRAN domain-containing protein n=1 Tax=Nakamurella aerolata TaxID=1656892 RepID=A0A849A6W4_9ACTN|nr:hypothetical protein [Nakamurella aerolata]